MDQKLVIGMDFGSDSVRAVLVDVKDGHEYVNAVCNSRSADDSRHFRGHHGQYPLSDR